MDIKAPSRSKFFHFMQFLVKIEPNNRLAHPSSGSATESDDQQENCKHNFYKSDSLKLEMRHVKKVFGWRASNV